SPAAEIDGIRRPFPTVRGDLGLQRAQVERLQIGRKHPRCEVAVRAFLRAKRIRDVHAGHYNLMSSPNWRLMAEPISSVRDSPLSARTNVPRSGFQSSLKLLECADTQIWRTGA